MKRIGSALVCWTLLSCLASAGQPQYKFSIIGSWVQADPFYAVGSYTTNGAITFYGGNKRFYFDGTNVIDLKTRWTGGIGTPLVTNNRGQFLLGANRYRENIDAPPVILQPAGDWAVAARAMGMTNNYIYGSQYRDASVTSSQAWYYNTVSGQYGFVDPTTFGFPGGEIMAMNDSGLMAIRFSHSIYGQGPNLDHAYLVKNGQTLAEFGHMSEAYVNTQGQVLGQDIWDVNHFKFWDGTQLHEFDSSAFGDDYRASGLSDDETFLMRDFAVGKLAIYKDGTFYKFQDVCPGLPPTMNFYGGKMRGDGAIAAFGRENGMSYLYRLEPVPEPASLVALSVGLLAIARRRSAASPR